MNIIKTVADLRKALSAYEDDLPFDILMCDGTARTDPIRGSFNNDTMIYREVRDNAPARLVISAIRN